MSTTAYLIGGPYHGEKRTLSRSMPKITLTLPDGTTAGYVRVGFSLFDRVIEVWLYEGLTMAERNKMAADVLLSPTAHRLVNDFVWSTT